MTLAVGDVAPDFTLPCSTGGTVTLSELRRSSGRNVVLFFYPKDDTPGCTIEACGFRDEYTTFADAGAEVLGISADSAESHQRFASRHQLPMKLLTDADGAVRKAYDVRPTVMGLLPGRATFVVDREGIIRHVFVSQLRVKVHVKEALAVVKSL